MIIETESLAKAGHPHRAIVLWMLNPTRHFSSVEDDPTFPYACPEHTRGSYYSGFVRISLIDTQKNSVINTVELKDSFDIPYRIRKGFYYDTVGRPGKNGERKAHVLSLKDYNGDGHALEFALFDAIACMGLDTALFGYFPKQDKIMQYQIKLDIQSDKGREDSISGWCDYLFGKKPISRGHWKYSIDYRGRGGLLYKYDIRYSYGKELFEGTLVSTEAEEVQ